MMEHQSLGARMFSKTLRTTAGAFALGLASVCVTESSASQITYSSYFTTTDNTGATPSATIVVDDDTAGLLSFAISTAGAVTGGLSGVGFVVNTSLAGMTESDILNESAPLQDFGLNAVKLGGAANFEGTYTNSINGPVFGFLLRLDKLDVSTTPFTFAIDDSFFGLGDLGLAGLRFQSVAGPGVTQDSAKMIGLPGVGNPPPIPLPAAGWLLIAGIGALAAARKSRRV
jgi:hypothetical protein